MRLAAALALAAVLLGCSDDEPGAAPARPKGAASRAASGTAAPAKDPSEAAGSARREDQERLDSAADLAAETLAADAARGETAVAPPTCVAVERRILREVETRATVEVAIHCEWSTADGERHEERRISRAELKRERLLWSVAGYGGSSPPN